MKSGLSNKSKQIEGLADVIIRVLVKELLTEIHAHNKHETFDRTGKGNKR